jgi:hypothetical protein
MWFLRSPAPSAEAIARALNGRRCRNGWSARCPAHDDHNPSLSITEDRDGRVLLHCFAGCPQWLVISTLRPARLFPGPGETAEHHVAKPGCSVVGAIQPDKLRQIWPKSMTDCWHGQSMSGRAWRRRLERLPTLELRRAPAHNNVAACAIAPAPFS